MPLENMFDRIGRSAQGDSRQELMFLLCGRSVQRFHTVPMVHGVTLAEHQFGVAWFVWLLGRGHATANLIMAALSHDMAEQLWGDIPAPGKRAMGITETFSEHEKKTLHDNNMQFQLSVGEEVVLKTADYMEGMLSCIHERRLGNRYAERPYYRFRGFINDLDLQHGPHYADSFSIRKRELLKALEELWNESFCVTNMTPSDNIRRYT